MTIEKERFGRDHWSTFAYLAHCATAREGEPDRNKMRTHPKNRHLMSQIQAMMTLSGVEWSKTRLAGGVEIDEHDDYDCMYDLIDAGLFLSVGSGAHPLVKLTDEGFRILKLVSDFLRAGVPGRTYGDFRPYDPSWAPVSP
jgi:predicted transcriptional regulator